MEVLSKLSIQKLIMFMYSFRCFKKDWWIWYVSQKQSKGPVSDPSKLPKWNYDGPSVGISTGDELWVARYILERITEIAGMVLSFDPKPIPGDWNGAGAHTNYSTKSMRQGEGYEIIKKAIDKLGLRHKKQIAAYGEGNELC